MVEEEPEPIVEEKEEPAPSPVNEENVEPEPAPAVEEQESTEEPTTVEEVTKEFDELSIDEPSFEEEVMDESLTLRRTGDISKFTEIAEVHKILYSVLTSTSQP